MKFFSNLKGTWIPREQNREADRLSKARLATKNPYEWHVVRKYKNQTKDFLHRMKDKPLKDETLKELVYKVIRKFD